MNPIAKTRSPIENSRRASTIHSTPQIQNLKCRDKTARHQRGRQKAMFTQISSRIPWSLINWGSHKAPKYYSTRHNNIIPHLKIHVRDNLLRLAQDNQSLLIGKRGTAILPRKESPSMSVCLRQRESERYGHPALERKSFDVSKTECRLLGYPP